MMSQKHIDRFWSKVSVPEDETKCWNWTACKFHHGHGVFRHEGKNLKAHRVSWELYFGKPEQNILHDCGNSSCVNPYHLKDGSHLENSRDRIKHGTHAKGEKNPNSKLSDEQRSEIKSLYYQSGLSQKSIADKFGVFQTTISRVLRNV